MHRKSQGYTTARLWLTSTIAAFTIVMAGTAMAMPPHPGLLRQVRDSSQSTLASKLMHAQSRPEGLDAPDDFFLRFLDKNKERNLSGAALSPTFTQYRILALLVDFSDNTSAVAPAFYDSLVYDSIGSTIHNYFSEISYAQIDLVTVNLPSTTGWTRAPQTYAYYVDGQRGIYGTYPRNSQGLVNDLVNLVDPQVDFSQYDNDGDGYVDVLLVIHAGTGAELTNNDNDIHSHKWSLPSPVSKDGVFVYSYTVQPEFWYSAGDMTIGVYSHELCHGFGLPDLYDTDYSSNGIGDWGIMAFGSWNGPSNLGGSPSHPCAWSRIQMGFATPVNVTGNQTAVNIAPVENGGNIYQLPTLSGLPNEYFLVENRQQSGYDAYLPGSGLLIWHIDANKPGNTEEWYPTMNGANHYKVALEQADGVWNLEKSTLSGNTGDIGDPFPGSTNRIAFNVGSTPSSDTYTAGSTLTAVNNITPSGANIIVDFVVNALAGIETQNGTMLPNEVTLSQNYPNPFNPTTTIQFSLSRGAEITIEVHNVLGQKVATVYEGYAGPGATTVQWDATDDAGSEVASGIYFYTLKAENEQESKKMVLLR